MTESPADLDDLAAKVGAASRAAQADPSHREAFAEVLFEFTEALHEHPERDAMVYAEALEALATVLRSLGRGEQAVVAAERSVEVVAGLAQHDAVRYLHPLARATKILGHCYQRAGSFERAAASFEQAVGGFAILAQAQREAHQLTLIEVMSDHALALAQSGQLERAYAVALQTDALATAEANPQLLPLIVGGKQFASDLASDLGRPSETIAHLVAGLHILERAIAESMPGASEAATRLAASLREASEQHGVTLEADVKELLAAVECDRV